MLRRLIFIGLWISAASFGQTPDIVIDGNAPSDASRFFELPFVVPAGVHELQVKHVTLSTNNIFDWGLFDPNGYRGYGGGNREDIVIGDNAASRSYLPGALPAGTWKLTVGKAKISDTPPGYHIEISFRSTPTLAAQTQRRPYAPVTLSTTKRWYAGDFHTHSQESGDARPSLDDMAALARSRGLDFLLISDHNTTSQLSWLGDAQDRHPDLLFMPGMEWTSYWGHASVIGSTVFEDQRVGFAGNTLDQVVRGFHLNGALFSINHPALDIGDMCIGCAWKQALPGEPVDGVEIATGGWAQDGFAFDPAAIAFWDSICASGIHAKAIGGSDDHHAGIDESSTGSTIGQPTTMVEADGLSTSAIVAGVRAGRTVVKLQDVNDPMIDFTARGDAQQADTIVAQSVVHLHAAISNGRGFVARFVKNGQPLDGVAIDSDKFFLDADVATPSNGEDRWRVEVLAGGQPRVVTSHLWLAQGFGRQGPQALASGKPVDACGCDVGGSAAGFVLVACLELLRRRKMYNRT